VWQSGDDWQMNWSNNGERMHVRASGSIEFTEDLTDVKSLADGGYLTLSHTIEGVAHRVEIRSSNGKITRTYSIDGRTRPWDDEARRWLASELPKLVRRSGLGAEARTRQILAAFTQRFNQARLDSAAAQRLCPRACDRGRSWIA
jgi:hypothetical protein